MRIFVTIVLLGCLGYMGWYLYERQHDNYHWRSFEQKNTEVSIQFTNINRFLQKSHYERALSYFSGNEQVYTGVQALFEQPELDYSAIVGRSCFLSANNEQFTLVFQYPDFSMQDLVDFLTTNFASTIEIQDRQILINGVAYFYDYFGNFIAFSNVDIQPKPLAEHSVETNADFVLYTDSTIIEKHLLVNGQEFKVWSDSGKAVRGKPMPHIELINRIPANFDQITYYSSQRFEEDQYQLFHNPDEESISWVANQLVVVKKDSFEILLAPQNDRRSLKLILEEQTLKANQDSGQIAYFNLKNYQIMPFASDFNWQSAIDGCDSKLQFYTEFENLNILANSISALFWYLGEVQTSGLIRDSDQSMQLVQRSTPFECHWLQILQSPDESLDFQTRTWKNKYTRVHTASNTGVDVAESDQMDGLTIELNESVNQIVAHAKGLYVFTEKEVVSFNRKGEKQGAYAQKVGEIISIQLIDLENDGQSELTIIGSKGLLVINSAAKVKMNVQLNNGAEISGGMIVNYDQKFDYRFFLTSGKMVYCFNENGAKVNGWQFAGSTANLTGKALYGQINGRDYLVFEDVSGNQYALNRRGEPRFQQTAQWQLLTASNFLSGISEETVSRLGYHDRYIYSYFLKDGSKDSLKLDQPVSATRSFWLKDLSNQLVIEEPGRVVVFNQFGYREHEVLKPLNAKKLVNVEKTSGLYFVFFDNTNNRIYLLNEDGKQLINQPSAQPNVYGITNKHFYTYDGSVINEHTLK